jgi:hypothetical protein
MAESAGRTPGHVFGAQESGFPGVGAIAWPRHAEIGVAYHFDGLVAAMNTPEGSDAFKNRVQFRMMPKTDSRKITSEGKNRDGIKPCLSPRHGGVFLSAAVIRSSVCWRPAHDGAVDNTPDACCYLVQHEG